MVKRIIYGIFMVIIGVTVINDAGRWMTTKYNLTEATREAARKASKEGNPRAAWDAASVYAESQNITIYGFEWTEDQATVWSQAEVRGTWVLGSVMVVFEGQPLTSTWVIRGEVTEPRRL